MSNTSREITPKLSPWKRRIDNLKAEGLCTRCGKEPVDDPKFVNCPACREHNRKGYAEKWGMARNKEYYQKYKNPYMRQYFYNLKLDTFDRYGGRVCACCGETEIDFLQLDHIDNNGAAHRKEMRLKKAGNQIYLWCRQNNYPEGFQVLCANCNWGKRLHGYCPHKRKVDVA